jgi:hypothetical protein
MQRYYVQSGEVEVIVHARDAHQAAVHAFQDWSERLADVVFGGDTEDRQLGNDMLVSEIGFGALDAEPFPTLDILMAWQADPVGVQ